MPTIIDSLVVMLGIDGGDSNAKAVAAGKNLKGLEDQADKTEASVKKVGKTSKETAKGFTEVASAAGKFLAVIGGTVALKAFISDLIEQNAQLDRLSKNLGLSVSTISAWSQATEQLGGSSAGLQGTLDMLSKAQTELKLTGTSGLIPYLTALGVSLADLNGSARPVDDLLLSLSDRFSKMNRTDANNMGRMMGIDQGTMNLLLLGRHELELTIQRQKESTAVTKAQAEEASKLQKSIVETRQKFVALGNALLLQAAPAIEKVLDLFLRFGNWVLQNSEAVGDFLKILAVGLAAIGIAALPIDLVVVAVIALVAALALLWQDYQTWKRGGDSLIDWGKWEPGITAAGKGLQWLGGIAKDTFGWLGKIAGHAAKAVGGGATEDPVAKANRQIALGGNGTTAGQARDLAVKVSAKTGIPADILWSQWAHETGGFTNRGARELNNLAGVNVPGGKGQDYRKFNSLDEFGDYYAQLMRPGGRYSGASSARTPEEFAAILKKGGYYSDSQSNYSAGINRYEKSPYAASLRGIPGAVASVGSTSGALGGGGSTSLRVDTINVVTQATDAEGIAKDIGSHLDYLFPSQANSGLN